MLARSLNISCTCTILALLHNWNVVLVMFCVILRCFTVSVRR